MDTDSPSNVGDPEDIIAARKKMSHVPPTIKIDTPERKGLRKEIARKLYGKEATLKDKRIDVVIGMPGAGKSSTVVNRLAKKTGSLVIDSDMAKEMLPEYKTYSGIVAGALHDESSFITEALLFEMAVTNGDNIILAKIGKNADVLLILIKKLKKIGYQIYIHHVHISKSESIKRAIDRFRKTGRFVDPDYIRSIPDGQIKKVFDIILEKGDIDGFSEWSNDDSKGKTPKLISESGPDAIFH